MFLVITSVWHYIMSKKTEFEQMDILQQALNRGIIDLTTIQQQVADMEREKIIKMHPHKMWQDFLEEQMDVSDRDFASSAVNEEEEIYNFFR